MNSTERQTLINDLKKRSFIEESQVVLEDNSIREYIRMYQGRVVEYDLTKFLGKNIKFSSEEQEGDTEFEYLPL